MRRKYKKKISDELMRDIVTANRLVRLEFKNKTVNYDTVEATIRSWRGEIGQMRRKRDSAKLIRAAELALGFLRDIHTQNIIKYEAYRTNRGLTI